MYTKIFILFHSLRIHYNFSIIVVSTCPKTNIVVTSIHKCPLDVCNFH